MHVVSYICHLLQEVANHEPDYSLIWKLDYSTLSAAASSKLQPSFPTGI
jgi:hypothetical protein